MVRYFYILTEAKSYQTKIKLGYPCFFFQTLADPNPDGTVLITIKNMKKNNVTPWYLVPPKRTPGFVSDLFTKWLPC